MWLNSDWTPQVCRSSMGLNRHVGLRWGMSVFDGACRSSMGHVGLRWGMSVFDGACQSPLGHAGLRWVSDQACRSPIKHVEVSDRSPIIIVFL